MSYYVMQNAEVVAEMLSYYAIRVEHGDTLRFKIDRKARTMTDDVTGAGWTIPDDWDLS